MTAPNQYVALTQLDLYGHPSPEGTETPSEDVEVELAFTEWRSAHTKRLEGIMMPHTTAPESFGPDIPSMPTQPKHLAPDAVPAVSANLLKKKPLLTSSHGRMFGGVQTKRSPGRADAFLPNTPDSMDHDSFPHSFSGSEMFTTFLSMSTITDNERNFLEELMTDCNLKEGLYEAFLTASCTEPRCTFCQEHKLLSGSDSQSGTRAGASPRVWRFQEDKFQSKLASGFRR